MLVVALAALLDIESPPLLWNMGLWMWNCELQSASFRFICVLHLCFTFATVEESVWKMAHRVEGDERSWSNNCHLRALVQSDAALARVGQSAAVLHTSGQLGPECNVAFFFFWEEQLTCYRLVMVGGLSLYRAATGAFRIDILLWCLKAKFQIPRSAEGEKKLKILLGFASPNFYFFLQIIHLQITIWAKF